MTYQTRLGILILHGWTAGLATVAHLRVAVEGLGLPIRLPILRGHDPSTSESLNEVHWQDWVADAESALTDLLTEADRVIIVGHSMGGMLAYHLAAYHPESIDSVISAGTPGKMNTPFAPGNVLHPLFCLLWRSIKVYNKGELQYADPALAALDDSPRMVPTFAIKQLFDFLKQQKKVLSEVRVPALILQSTRDSSAAPVSACMIYNQISTPTEEKRIIWFDKTEHAMFLDIEKEYVISVVIDYIKERMRLRKENYV